MNPAPRALSSLGLVFFLLAAGAAAQPGTAEMTVEFESPARAVVRTRIPTSHPLAQSASFHALAPSPDTGWQRRPASFERAAAELVFGDSAGAGEAGRFQIGVPLPDTAPEAGADSAFSVRITPPPGYRIADDFPALTPGGPAGGTLEAHLPAPPALLRFRLVPEEEFAISLTTLVDGALALLLIGLGVFGARRLLAPPPPAGASSP